MCANGVFIGRDRDVEVERGNKVLYTELCIVQRREWKSKEWCFVQNTSADCFSKILPQLFCSVVVWLCYFRQSYDLTVCSTQTVSRREREIKRQRNMKRKTRYFQHADTHMKVADRETLHLILHHVGSSFESVVVTFSVANLFALTDGVFELFVCVLFLLWESLNPGFLSQPKNKGFIQPR